MSVVPKKMKFKIPSEVCQVHQVEKKLEAFCHHHGMNQNDTENCAIAVTEAVNNAIRHGNKEDASKAVHIEFECSESLITIRITDEGNGFDPENLNDPLHPENLLKENGRGIFIVNQLMDDVQFNFSKTGTTIILTKRFSIS